MSLYLCLCTKSPEIELNSRVRLLQALWNELLNVCDRLPLGKSQWIIFEGHIVFHISALPRGGLIRPLLNTLDCKRCSWAVQRRNQPRSLWGLVDLWKAWIHKLPERSRVGVWGLDTLPWGQVRLWLRFFCLVVHFKLLWIEWGQGCVEWWILEYHKQHCHAGHCQ